MRDKTISAVLELLDLHYTSFHAVEPYATATEHPVPSDTRGWSQILVSLLTGVKGIARKKGADLADGSDVKGACSWEAIDVPRFNNVIKAGTKSAKAGKMDSLDAMPYLFFVLWDMKNVETARCRVWVVRPAHDKLFRKICAKWYKIRADGTIKSDNFQLHPPIGKDDSVFSNKCGNLVYPLLFCAERSGKARYQLVTLAPGLLKSGACRCP